MASAKALYLAEQERSLREGVDIMRQDLALVQEDAHFKRWLKEPHQGL